MRSRRRRLILILFIAAAVCLPLCLPLCLPGWPPEWPPALSAAATQVSGPSLSLTGEDRAYIEGLGTIAVAADNNFIPLSRFSDRGYSGASVELFETIAEEIGLSYQYVLSQDVSWSEKMDPSRF